MLILCKVRISDAYFFYGCHSMRSILVLLFGNVFLAVIPAPYTCLPQVCHSRPVYLSFPRKRESKLRGKLQRESKLRDKLQRALFLGQIFCCSERKRTVQLPQYIFKESCRESIKKSCRESRFRHWIPVFTGMTTKTVISYSIGI